MLRGGDARSSGPGLGFWVHLTILRNGANHALRPKDNSLLSSEQATARTYSHHLAEEVAEAAVEKEDAAAAEKQSLPAVPALSLFESLG
jgi:hypothetical protein